jgi:hypothetical protein
MQRSMRTLTRATLALAWLAAAACARPAVESAGAPGSRTVLTQQQLSATNARNLYEAIEKLRPDWLTSRGPTSVTDDSPSVASVYINGTMIGKADALRDFAILDVTEVRYWDVGQASARFGMGHPRGVIELSRR